MKTAIKLTSSFISILLLAAPAGAYSTATETNLGKQAVNIHDKTIKELINKDKLQSNIMLTCAYRACTRLPKQDEAIHQFRSSLILPKKQLDQRI